MADHDPMCPLYATGKPQHILDRCRCEEYDRVRANERTKDGYWGFKCCEHCAGQPGRHDGGHAVPCPECQTARAAVAEEIAAALESELQTSSRVPPPDDAPWECSGTRIHGTAEVRRDAAAIARRFAGVQPCTHCTGDPPKGHRCPACGIGGGAVTAAEWLLVILGSDLLLRSEVLALFDEEAQR